MALNPEQVRIIKSTVPVLQAHGNAITTTFYDTLLKEVPSLNNVFNKANQSNGHQATALAASLYAYASHIDDLGALSPAVEKICQKHVSLYIRPEQYETVGEYLLRAMGKVLGSAFTQDMLDAWGAAYWQLASMMIKREEQLLQQADGWTDWREFIIANKIKESEEITSFYLKPLDGNKLPSFRPGQFISVLTHVPKLHYLQSRQYSLSDAPKSDYYRISVKREMGVQPDQPGYISNVMHDDKNVGDIIYVSHPAGDFFLDPKSDKDKPIVLLCAGVGLTPMIAMLNHLVSSGSTQRISLIHGARTSKVRAFATQLQNYKARYPHISYIPFVKQVDHDTDVHGREYAHIGRVDLRKLDKEKDLCLDSKTAHYFVCGPNQFMADIEKGLMSMGVEKDRISMEVFGTGDISRN